MELTFVDGKMPTSPTLLARCQARMGRVGRRFSSWVNRIEVHLHDEDGPRHSRTRPGCGCRVHATVNGVGVVAVHTVGPDFFAAVDAASAKLARALEHRVGRRRGR